MLLNGSNYGCGFFFFFDILLGADSFLFIKIIGTMICIVLNVEGLVMSNAVKTQPEVSLCLARRCC